jgi:hypothetical protein
MCVGFRKRALSLNKADYVRAIGVNPTLKFTRYIKKVMAPVEGGLPGEKEQQWVFEWDWRLASFREVYTDYFFEDESTD